MTHDCRDRMLRIALAALVWAASVGAGIPGEGRADPAANTTASHDIPAQACFVHVDALPHDDARTFDLSLNGLTLREALSFLLQGTEYRLVADGLIDVPVSGTLANVTWPEALEVLALRHDVDVQLDGNRVILSSEESRSFRVDYVGDLENDLWIDLEADLAALLTPTGRLVVSPRVGTVTVIDLPSSVRRIRDYLKELERTLHEQVDIEARILELDLGENFEMGVDWNVLEHGWDTISGNTASGGLLELDTANGAGVFQMGLIRTDRLETFFDFLEDRGDLRVISRPRVASMANEPALFRMTDNVPYYTIEVISTDGAQPYIQYDVDFKEAGVLLSVNAHVGEDERIVLEVKPSISSITGFTESLPNLPPQPIIDVRETETSVRLAEGQSLIIGGLIETLEQKNTRGIPVLGSIPYLGALFRSTSIVEEKRELIVLLTPTRVRDARREAMRKASASLPVDAPRSVLDGDAALAAHWHDRALHLFAAGDVAEAITIARRAVTADPSEPTWKLNLGFFLAHAGRFDEAADVWNQLRRTGAPFDEWARLNLEALALCEQPALSAAALARESVAEDRRLQTGETRGGMAMTGGTSTGDSAGVSAGDSAGGAAGAALAQAFGANLEAPGVIQGNARSAAHFNHVAALVHVGRLEEAASVASTATRESGGTTREADVLLGLQREWIARTRELR